MNENEMMAEFANNLWNNFIEKKVNDMLSDSVTYYRAKVVQNTYSSDGKVTIQRPFEEPRKVKCSDQMKAVPANKEVLVLRFGNGSQANEIVVADGKGTKHYI